MAVRSRTPLSSLKQLAMASSRRGSAAADGDGILSRASSSISNSPAVYHSKKAASEVVVVAKKLLWSTGRAAWIAGTTFLVLIVPLIIEMDREQQMNDLELQQASLLGAPPAGPPPPPLPSK